MRLGLLWDAQSSAGNYRGAFPMRAMERRGHEVVWPDPSGTKDARALTSCDVVHVYRRNDEQTLGLMADLARAGIGVTWDNDDDYTLVPKEHPVVKQRGIKVVRELYRNTVRAATIAHGVTATTEAVADRYRGEGVGEVEVIPNYLDVDAVKRGRRHQGLVVGWVAGLEHRADADRIGISAALERLMAKHREVRVECIGVDLGLTARYRHDAFLHFLRLADRIAGFDIGIAPLADIPFNWARSDIKLKEYAARGVPWLASPVGPYVGLGEEQGGRLVPDDGWFEALDRLVEKGRERRRLARNAKGWAKTQTIEAAADRWERHFVAAAEAARKPTPAAA